MRTRRNSFALKTVAAAVLCLFLLIGGDVYAAADEQEVFNSYMEAAEQGDAEAQFNVGCCYAEGEGVPKNMEEAAKWFRKAAEQGLAEAQFNLGVSYANGDGVPQNWEESVKWWRKAAEQGLPDAQNNLAICYDEGKGVERNHKEALQWFRKAADQGEPVALHNLGSSYGMEILVPIAILLVLFYVVYYIKRRRRTSELPFIEKVAEEADAQSQFNFGMHYFTGFDIATNYKKAAEWLRKAADQGHEEA